MPNIKCSLHRAKKLFYRSANAIFGEIGRTASEEVVLQLIISKCIPVIMYFFTSRRLLVFVKLKTSRNIT